MRATCVFRVDALPTMGIGHLSRCLALAHALKESGVEVHFVCRDGVGSANWLVQEQGFCLHSLPSHASLPESSDSRQWLGCTQKEDASATREIIESLGGISWLVIDHYAADAEWESLLRPVCDRILAIDDLANRRHDCDVLLDQSLRGENPYVTLIPPHAVALLGPRYALLRREFSQQREQCQIRTGNVGRVMVFFGGSDPNGDTQKTVRALLSLPNTIHTDVIVGAMNPARQMLEEICKSTPHLHFACQVRDMAERLAKVDLAIGAAGTSSWERLCLGVPSLLIEQAENQRTNMVELSRRGLALPLGDSSEVGTEDISQALQALIACPEDLHAMSAMAWKMVDGLGAWRVASAMLQPRITVRRATDKDCQSIFEWRNAEEVRRYSHDSSELNFEEHQSWYTSVIANSNRYLLLCDQTSLTAGVVRFDQEGSDALVSIYLTPPHLGRNLGIWVLNAAERWLIDHHPEISRLLAEVLADNKPSHAMFLAAGYSYIGDHYEKRIRHE